MAENPRRMYEFFSGMHSLIVPKSLGDYAPIVGGEMHGSDLSISTGYPECAFVFGENS